MKQKIYRTLLLPLVFMASCGNGLSGDTSGETIEIGQSVTCIAENDCDNDGVYTDCDVDDSNSDAFDISEDCDEDADGYVDTPCTSYEDIDGDGRFTADVERMEYGVNCDVCPDMTDPDQEDTDEDGVGDLCVIDPNINLNAEPSEYTNNNDSETDVSPDESAPDESTNTDTTNDDSETVDDADGDGLSLSIDPDPSQKNSWGFVDMRENGMGCVPEKRLSNYNYYKGYLVGGLTIKTTASTSFRTAKTPSVTHTVPGNIVASAGKITVGGVTDTSQATLTVYECPGDSSDQDFSYGIYIVSSALKATKTVPVIAPTESLLPSIR